ncbi:MAG: DUF58 domain-containing protein [Rhizomicrobium sp.]
MTDTDRQPQKSNGARALGAQAEALAAPLPPLLVAAERLSSVVDLGVHGRRKAGMGETFWQFRRYTQGDASNAIDWRQSAKSQHLFVREREWEVAHAIWFWRDGSAGMRFASDRNLNSKCDRASLLALALASLLVRGGERIALLGGEDLPAGGHVALNRMAHRLTCSAPQVAMLPPNAPAGRNAQLVWLSDFLSPMPDIDSAIRKLASAGLTGHLVHLIDPVEEDFPFSGSTRFEWRHARENEIFGRAESVREDYRRRFRAQADSVSELARRLGWSYLAHRTDHRPEMALIALYANLGGMPAHNAQAGMQ